MAGSRLSEKSEGRIVTMRRVTRVPAGENVGEEVLLLSILLLVLMLWLVPLSMVRLMLL